MSYTPKGETVNLNNVEFVLAVNRIASRAMSQAHAEYNSTPDQDRYQALLDKATASSKKYRQIASGFDQKEMEYKNRLAEGMPSEETDYRTEIEAAAINSQFFREMAEKEDEKALVASSKLRKLWENAFNSVAGQLGYNNTWGQVETEARAIEREITNEIYRRIDTLAEERAATNRRIVIEANKGYLTDARTSTEGLLRSLFGEYVYVGEHQITHVDGRLDHEIPVMIYTVEPEDTISALPKELETPQSRLTLVSSELIPLNDGTGTSIVQVSYRGSKPLHY